MTTQAMHDRLAMPQRRLVPLEAAGIIGGFGPTPALFGDGPGEALVGRTLHATVLTVKLTGGPAAGIQVTVALTHDDAIDLARAVLALAGLEG